jgi:hypothetical protein
MLDLYSSQTSYLHYYPSVFPTMILVYLKSRIGIFNFSSLVLTSRMMCISNLTSFWGFPVIVQVVGGSKNWRRNFMLHYMWFCWFLCGGTRHKTTNLNLPNAFTHAMMNFIKEKLKHDFLFWPK